MRNRGRKRRSGRPVSSSGQRGTALVAIAEFAMDGNAAIVCRGPHGAAGDPIQLVGTVVYDGVYSTYTIFDATNIIIQGLYSENVLGGFLFS